MVSNPFQEGASVKVSSDTSGFDLSGATDGLLNFKTAALGVGTALAGGVAVALGKSASAAMDFEAAMADVEKVTDEQTADELSEPIQEMAEEIPIAAEEIANLSAQAGRFGAEGTEEIENFTETAAKMGSATTLAADEAGRSLAKVATALDEPLEDVDDLGNAINELSNNFATSSQEIVDAAQRGGFAVSNLGLGSNEILGLTAAMNEVAPTARRAGNMLKQMGESLSNPDNAAAFADVLGVTNEEFQTMLDDDPEQLMLDIAEAMEENEDASESLSDSLTTQQVRAFQRLSQQTDEFSEAMDMSNQAVEDGTSLQRELEIETNSLQGQMRLLKSEVRNLMRDLGRALLPIIKDVVSVLSDLSSNIDSLKQGNSEFIEEIKETIAVFEDLFGTADGDLHPILQDISDIIRTLAKNRLKNLKEQFELIMNLIQGDFGEAWQNLKNIFNNTKDAIGDIEDAISNIANRAIDGLVNYLQNDAEDDIRSALDSFTDFVMDRLRDINLTAIIGNAVVNAKEYLEEDAWDDIKGGFSSLISAIANFFTGDGEDSASAGMREAIIDFGQGIGEALIQAIQDRITDNEIRFQIPEQTLDFGKAGEVTIGGDQIAIPLSPPELDTGGLIEEGGLAKVHAGERVIPEAQVTDRGQVEASGGGEITLILEENTDVIDSRIEQSAENVIVKQKRRTQRKTGRSNANISG